MYIDDLADAFYTVALQGLVPTKAMKLTSYSDYRLNYTLQ
jgi:hypothetical protein